MKDIDDVSPAAGRALLQALDDQLGSPETPEVACELRRLLAAGIKNTEAKHLMAQVLGFHIVRLMKGTAPFDYEGYLAELKRLPDIDYDQAL